MLRLLPYRYRLSECSEIRRQSARPRSEKTGAVAEGTAASLQRGKAVLHAALTLQRKDGQVEEQLNRLKTIKRQMYRQSQFDPLSRRFLYLAD